MNLPQPTPTELAALAAFDTPTICNALEVVMPETRARGYTTRPAVCGFPALKPMVGYARTARIRAKVAPTFSAAEVRNQRHDYYRYVDAGPKPSVVLIQDLDGADAGYGVGPVEIPVAAIRDLPAAIDKVAKREASILAVARAPNCTAEKLIAVFKEQDAIH